MFNRRSRPWCLVPACLAHLNYIANWRVRKIHNRGMKTFSRRFGCTLQFFFFSMHLDSPGPVRLQKDLASRMRSSELEWGVLSSAFYFEQESSPCSRAGKWGGYESKINISQLRTDLFSTFHWLPWAHVV